MPAANTKITTDPAERKDIASRIRYIVSYASCVGITETSLATTLNVHPMTLSRWKREGGPSVEGLRSLCEETGFLYDWAAYGKGERFEDMVLANQQMANMKMMPAEPVATVVSEPVEPEENMSKGESVLRMALVEYAVNMPEDKIALALSMMRKVTDINPSDVEFMKSLIARV